MRKPSLIIGDMFGHMADFKILHLSANDCSQGSYYRILVKGKALDISLLIPTAVI